MTMPTTNRTTAPEIGLDATALFQHNLQRVLAPHSYKARLPLRSGDFTKFKRKIWPKYTHSPHIDALDRLLERVLLFIESRGEEGIQNLTVSMPRRYSKSLSVSQIFPTYFLGRNPDHRAMLAGYSGEISERSSRRARNFLVSPEYPMDVSVAMDNKKASSWSLESYEGGVDAIGVRGGATGKGWTLLICDDLIKSREEAESPVIRDKVWDELQDSFFSGADYPFATRIMVGTRWHVDDPIGRLLQREPGKWFEFKLPALIDEPQYVYDDTGALIFERQPDEPLWESRHSIEALYEIKDNLDPYSWASLWQQEPIDALGGFFQREWFNVVSEPPEIVYSVRFWDLAMSDKPTADYTVGVKMGYAVDGHYYILDVVRRRVDWGELVNWIATVILEDGPSVSQGVEEAGYMTRAVRDLNADPRLHQYSVMGFPVDKAKHVRALPVQGRFSNNHMHLVRAHWNDTYINEFVAFMPRGSVHDDQVDATSGAWAMMDGDTGQGYVSW